MLVSVAFSVFFTCENEKNINGFMHVYRAGFTV